MNNVRKLGVLLLLLVLLGAGLAATYAYRFYSDRSLPQTPASLVVPRGSTGHAVAELLAEHGIVRSARAFELLARLKGEQNRMQAGEFRFPAHETASAVLRQLVEGGAQVAVWITIPEGYTATEIAQTLALHRLGSQDALARTFLHSSLALPGANTPNLEGYLFPDTYLVPTDATPAQIARLMTEQFRRELPPGAAGIAKQHGLTIPAIVTLASLVEREAKSDDERPLMAGVYYNRLRRGMPLEVDATLEYTFPHHKDVITYADLARDSPYNTYKHTGLPPTPIANPGRASLLAAFAPQASDYLFYVYMGNGHHAFSRTLAEHNANVARYVH